jgi:RNA polymerase sigma factor (sigma-70 family)
MTDLRKAKSDPEPAATLAARLRSRDPHAIEELYSAYVHQVSIVILRIVNNPAVAEDLVQDCFLKAWSRAGQLNEDCNSIGPWLVTIARHCALDYKKSREARLVLNGEPVDLFMFSAKLGREFPLCDRIHMVAEALECLTASQKRVIELAYFEGLSQLAIAQLLGRPLGTVKGLMRAALRRLRSKCIPVDAGSAQTGALSRRRVGT